MVRFNWPKYALGVAIVLTLLTFSVLFDGTASTAFAASAALAGMAILLPLWVSHLVYDRSDLYRMDWLDTLGADRNGIILNINAGFDETTPLLRERFRECTVHALDFYDPEHHTEPSIELARKFASRTMGTIGITTSHLPYDTGSIDAVLCFLSLHEVRDARERVRFLTEVHRVLKPDGRFIVTEHLRDPANFIAFNFGFLHFHSRATWDRAFREAGFAMVKVVRTTPFVSTFILNPT